MNYKIKNNSGIELLDLTVKENNLIVTLSNPNPDWGFMLNERQIGDLIDILSEMRKSINGLSRLSIHIQSLDFRKVWNRWEYFRKVILKKPLTETSRKSQLLFLNKFKKETAIRMVQRSIDNCWQGIFEIKEKQDDYFDGNIL